MKLMPLPGLLHVSDFAGNYQGNFEYCCCFTKQILAGSCSTFLNASVCGFILSLYSSLIDASFVGINMLCLRDSSSQKLQGFNFLVFSVAIPSFSLEQCTEVIAPT